MTPYPRGIGTAQQVATRALGSAGDGAGPLRPAGGVSSDRLRPMKDMKPLGELLLVACIALREESMSKTQLASDLIDFAWAQLRDGEVLYEIQREQPIETYPIEFYVWLDPTAIGTRGWTSWRRT